MNLILKLKSLDPKHHLDIDVNQELSLSLLESIDNQLQDFAIAVIYMSAPIYIEKFSIAGFSNEDSSAKDVSMPAYAVPKLSIASSFKFIDLYHTVQTLMTIVKKNFNENRELAIAKLCASLTENDDIDFAVNNINDSIESIFKTPNMSRSKAQKHFYNEKVQLSIKNAVEAKLDALTVDLLKSSLENEQAMRLFYTEHYELHWLSNSDYYYITAR